MEESYSTGVGIVGTPHHAQLPPHHSDANQSRPKPNCMISSTRKSGQNNWHERCDWPYRLEDRQR